MVCQTGVTATSLALFVLIMVTGAAKVSEAPSFPTVIKIHLSLIYPITFLISLPSNLCAFLLWLNWNNCITYVNTEVMLTERRMSRKGLLAFFTDYLKLTKNVCIKLTWSLGKTIAIFTAQVDQTPFPIGFRWFCHTLPVTVSIQINHFSSYFQKKPYLCLENVLDKTLKECTL